MTDYQPAPSTNSVDWRSRQVRRGIHLLAALSMALVLLTAVYSWVSNAFSKVSSVSAQGGNLIVNGTFTDNLEPWIPSGGAVYTSAFGGAAEILDDASIKQVEINVNSTGIYQFSFDCTNTGFPGNAEVSFTFDPLHPHVAAIQHGIFPTLACDDAPEWSTFTYLIQLQEGHTYSLTIAHEDSHTAYVDNVELVRLYDVADLETGLINNGEFTGPDSWSYDGEVYQVMDIGAGDVITHLGAASLFVDISQGFPEVSLYQVVVPSETGVYQLSFECIYFNGGGSNLWYEITTNTPNVAPSKKEACTENNYQWIELSSLYILEAGVPYTVTFTIPSSDLVPEYILDNVSLKFLYNAEDLNTGSIQNGEFIGPASWEYSEEAYYQMDVGPQETRLGSVVLVDAQKVTQTNIIVSGDSTPYLFSFDCIGRSTFGGLTTGNISYKLESSNVNIPPLDENVGCPLSPTSGWAVYEQLLILGAGTYTLTFYYDRTSGDPPGVLLDDVSLKEPSLLDFMIWNLYGECPFCNAASAVGSAGGPINTHNGNLSYQETDLSIPAAGGNLEFRRSYASQAIDTYTSLMGYGWVHNFDMRIHTNDVEIPGTVEFQTPGGSRLPFFDNGDGTYTPYPGVTAELVSDTNQYTLTAFNQNTYYFDKTTGRLEEQQDPSGNTITFTYNGSGQLVTAAQGARSLTYAYYPGGRLHTVTDHTGRIIELVYDPTTGDLVQVIDALNQITEYTYVSNTHLLTKVEDPSGRIVEETFYDAQGRAYQQKDGEQRLLVDIDYALSATNGLTENVVTENGVTVIHSYDERRTLVETTPNCTGVAGCGATTDSGYDGNFKADFIQDANGNLPTVLEWNNGGSNLEQVTNALNQTTSMAYDGTNNLTQVEDALNRTTEYTYSSNPAIPTFLVAVQDTLGNVTVYTPTIAGVGGDTISGLLKATRDPNGNVTTYQYNSFGQVTQMVAADGTPDAVTTTYQYDTVGRLIVTTQTSASESHKTLYAYDTDDRLVATIANWAGSNPADWETNCVIPAVTADTNVCTRYGYDPAGRPISTTNTLGQTNLTFYDNAGRVTKSVVNYDGVTPFANLCTSFTNPNPEYNICSLTGYDEFGRVVTTTNSLGHQTVTEYNPLGRVSRTIVNWQNGIYNTAFPDQDLITLYEYDAVGNVILTTDALGRKTRTFYDELNRVKVTVANWQNNIELKNCYDGSLSEIRDDNVCTGYEYDAVGNTILITDTLGRVTRTFYDELNRVKVTVANWQPTSIDPVLFQCELSPLNTAEENICTLYGYDAAGRQITTTNALNQTTLTVYDAANRPVVQVVNWDRTTPILPDGTGCADTEANPLADENLCTFTSYDSLGRRESTTDVMGVVTTFAYDGLGRVIMTTQQSPNLQSPISNLTSYDALGNRLNQIDAEGHTTNYGYDSLNRLETTTSEEGVVVTQVYNAASWLMSASNNLNQETTYTYDDLGRRLTVTDPEGHTTEYTYDALGNQVRMTDAEEVQTTYGYDGLNRLEQVIENEVSGNNPTDETDVLTQYIYNAIGNRVVITNALGFTSSLTTYDDLNRPIVITDALGYETHLNYYALGNRDTVLDANGELTDYSYDTLNRVSSIHYTADLETVTYTYDARGNVLTMSDSLGQTSYEYDGFGRLITVTNPFNETILYGYDKVGNRTSLTYPDNRVVTYTYDGDNRLVGVMDWDGGVTTYTYDGIGRLAAATLPNQVQTIYTYDDANRLTNLAHYNLETGDLIAEYEYLLDDVGNRIRAIERFRLPAVGSAALPAGVTYDAPLDAEAVIAAIQPPDPAKDLITGKRTPSPFAPPLSPLSPLPSLLASPPSLLTPTLPFTGTTSLTPTIPLGDTPLPFDPVEIVEQAENTIQLPTNGDTPYVSQETHEIQFEDGSITFAVVTETTPLTPSPVHPLTLTVALAEIAIGNQPLFVGPDTNVPDFEANIARFDLGNGLTEEFVARNAGVEQRWWLETDPGLNGDLTIEVEVSTPLSLTLDGNGFLFYTPAETEELPVIEYKRAVVIDAAGGTYWAHLSAETVSTNPDGVHTYRLQMTFPATWLANAQYPLLVDPLISPVLRLEATSPSSNQNNPSVAYNPDDNEYLVVWQDYRNGNADIYGQLVAANGALLGENLTIKNGANDQVEPQVEYGGGLYLVAWRHNTNPADPYAYDAYAQLLSNTGQLVGSVLTIDATATESEKPTDIVYNSNTSNFLVLWQNRSSGGNWDILGRLVPPNGMVDATVLNIAVITNRHEANARGVYDPANGQYLVAWGSWIIGSPSSQDIRGRIIVGTTLGSEITISDAADIQNMPDVAYLPDTNRYLVVWHDNRNGATNGYDIYAQKVTISGSMDGSSYALANGNASEQNPRLVVDTFGEAMVVWQKDNGGGQGIDLYGRHLGTNGLALNSEFAVLAANTNQSIPVVAGVGNGRALVVWQDERHTNPDIYARLLQMGGTYSGDFMVHPAAGEQKGPQVAYNSTDNEYLVVWQDFRSGTDWDIYGQLVSGSGELLGDNLIIYADLGVYDQTAPQVAYGNGFYLVAWQHTSSANATTDVYGQFVGSSGTLIGAAQHIAEQAASSKDNETPTDVIYNPNNSKFLVVWQHYGSGYWKIWGRYVLSNLTMETPVQLSFGTGQEETNAVVAHYPTSNEYLIVWEYQLAVGNKDIYGRRFGSTLNQLGSLLQIATGTASQQSPDVLYFPSASRYLVAWQAYSTIAEQQWDINGRLYQTNGNSDGSSYLLSTQPGDESYPRLALSLSGDALLLWQWQHSLNDVGIYGVKLDTDGQPYGDVFPVIDPQNNQERVALAYNGSSSHLITWQDNQVTGWNTYAALFQPWQETVITYTYDPLYRLTEADYAGTLNANYQYRYDAVGNMTFFTETVGTETTRVQRYFNATNELIDSFDYDDGTTSFFYDGNGNLINQIPPGGYIDIWYRYNQRNLLTTQGHSQLAEEITDATFAYDGAGNRLQQVDYTTGSLPLTITYTNDILGLSQVLVANDGTTQTYNLFGLDLISQDDGTDTRYLLADGLGSVRTEMVDGTIETLTTYEPYGNLLSQTGTSETVYSFTGEQQDGATGLLYLRARYYNVALRSFMTKDPWAGSMQRPISMNGYVYVSNNPVNFVDPTGYREWGRVRNSPGEQAVEWLYEWRNPTHIHLEFDALYGYSSSLSPRMDILNTSTGDIYELEPLTGGPTLWGIGIAQSIEYEFLLKTFGGGGYMFGYSIPGMSMLPHYPINFNAVTWRQGVPSNFPPIVHSSPFPGGNPVRSVRGQLQPIPPGFDLIAVSPVNGLVLWWIQPNPTITATAFAAAQAGKFKNRIVTQKDALPAISGIPVPAPVPVSSNSGSLPAWQTVAIFAGGSAAVYEIYQMCHQLPSLQLPSLQVSRAGFAIQYAMGSYHNPNGPKAQ